MKGSASLDLSMPFGTHEKCHYTTNYHLIQAKSSSTSLLGLPDITFLPANHAPLSKSASEKTLPGRRRLQAEFVAPSANVSLCTTRPDPLIDRNRHRRRDILICNVGAMGNLARRDSPAGTIAFQGIGETTKWERTTKGSTARASASR